VRFLLGFVFGFDAFLDNGSGGDPAPVFGDRVHWPRWGIIFQVFDIWSFEHPAGIFKRK